MTITADRLDHTKKLEGAGVPIAQAEQQLKLLVDVLGKSIPKLIPDQHLI